MNNLEIRKAMLDANLKNWQLAELLGVTEWTLSRWLRKELPQEKKDEIMGVIKNAK